jgi:RNA polymerase sigma factor (sigma-70 family)
MVSYCEPISKNVETAILRRARQLARQRGFSVSDTEDIAQQLRLRVIQAGRRFRQALGSKDAYLMRVVENAAVSEVRRARAKCRDSARTRAMGMHDPHISPMSSSRLSQDLHLADLKEGVSAALKTLNAIDRIVAGMLGDGMSRAEVGRQLNLSRRAVDKRIANIRGSLVWSQLKEYLE